MITKEEILREVAALASRHELSEGEVVSAYRQGANINSNIGPEEKARERTLSASKILYFLGGTVILIGIIIFIEQNWLSLGSIGQILVTLGVAVAAYIVGLFLRTKPELNVVSQIFAAIGAILMPLGLAVLFHNMGVQSYTAEINLIISGICLIMFGASLIFWRDVVFALFSIIFGTWVYGALTSLALRDLGRLAHTWHLYQYLIMAVGLAYLFIGYALSHNSRKEYRRLSKTVFFAGTIAFLSPGLTIGKAWDGIYPFLVFGTIFLSIYIRNSIFLRLGSMFLMAYLVKVSYKYFAHDLGWPLALIIGGLLLMGVGYVTFYLNKKYIKSKSTVM